MPELQSLEQEPEKKMSLFGAISIGIGGMVGGGLFAMMGMSVFYARSAVGLSFLLAGITALFTGYSYAKLARHFQDKGGSVAFITKVIQNSYLASWLNLLLILSYVIITGLYAYVFGSYFSALFPNSNVLLIKHLAICFSLLVAFGLNFLSEKYVGKAETLIVFIKIAILITFLVLGFRKINVEALAPSSWPSFTLILGTAGLLFLSYEGFELIANSAHRLEKPEKNISRSIYISIITVIAIYILVSLITVGSLPISALATKSEHILSEAARVIYPPFGYQIIAITAVLASISAETATFFGTSRIVLVLSEYKHLPSLFSKNYRGEISIWGIILMLGTTLLIANFLNLENIATMASGGFLIIFGMINIVCCIKHKELNSLRFITILGAITALVCLIMLIYHASTTHPHHILFFIIMIVLSGILSFTYQKFSNKSAT